MHHPSMPTGLRSFVVSLALVLLAVPLAAQGNGNGKTPTQRRNELRPARNQLKNDPEFQRLAARLDGNTRDPKIVDEYLAYLPLSPVEMTQIDMEDGRFELSIPKRLREWHTRWIELHETKARALYGDVYVDQELLRGFSELKGDVGAKVGPTLTKATTVGTNRNAAATFSPSPLEYQGEIQVAVNPNNPNQIVAAANTWDDISGTCADGLQAVFYSSDGGATWGYTCPPDDGAYSGITCNNIQFGSDPAVAWDDSGNVFLEYMLLCTPGNGNYQYSIVVARSTNGGATWSGQGVVANSYSTVNQIEDKEFLAIDTNSSSSFYGRMYSCWDRNNNEKFAYSTNGGSTWTEVDLPSASGGGFDLGCDIAVEDNGTVHVVFNNLTCGASCTNERMFYTRSTNGGVSWSASSLLHDFNLVGFSGSNCPDAQDDRCIGGFGTIAVDNSGGICDGTLYATYSDYTSGGVANTDVWVRRSTNGGSSWSSGVLVNDDGLTGRVQFHPYMEVDQTNGQLVVGWHDARNDSGNDAIDYFVTRSTDCGVSFETNVQVSQATSEFNNSSISYSNENSSDNPNYNPNQYGEYMGVDAHACKAYLAWADTRHFFPGSTSNAQKENMGFAVVDFDCATCGDNVAEGSEVCDGTDLSGETCVSQGFSGGTLACNGTCTGFDTSGCTGGPVCGNNTIEGSEVCDGTDLGGETCVSQGFAGGGTLACLGDCTGFDTSGCSAGSCTTATLYSHDFESGSGLSDWTRGTFDGSNVNVWRGIQTCSAASGSHIFRFGGSRCTRNYSSNRFIFAQPNGASGISVPGGSSDATLTFNHRRQFETGYDGGLVALSLDGSNYTVVPASAITSGASYDGTVIAACEPTGAAGLPIFTGTQSSFVSTTIDLDAACDLITSGSGGCAGQSLYIAFTGISDCSSTRDGWFLDDVVVTACTP